MTAEVEQRIVQMRFENEQFEKAAKQSVSTLEKLEDVLDMLGSGGGLEKIGQTLDTVERRFSTFGIAGAAAVQRVTDSVLSLASSLLTAIPNQIISGGIVRASNIERAQFQLKGLGVAWEEISDDIDFAVKDTAYGLDEAAVAAAQFAASLGSDSYKNAPGEISEMARALRGISGVAGMTNSSYSEIANIFTGIAGTGHVMTQDLRMLEGRGLNVAAKLAEVLEQDGNNAHYTEEQIRDLVSKGKISFRDFAKAMDFAFGEHAKKANETYTGSLANMKAALSRIGADFVSPVHTGMIKVQNSLRDTFNRMREVTKPFAEGTFTEWMTVFSNKVSMLAGKIDFGWLKALTNFLSNLDITPIANIFDKVGNLIEYINGFFDWSFSLNDKNPLFNGDAAQAMANGVQRLNRIQRILRAIRSTFSFFSKSFDLAKRQLKYIAGTAINVFDKVLGKTAELADKFYYGNMSDTIFAKMQGLLGKLDGYIGRVLTVLKGQLWPTIKVGAELLGMLGGKILQFAGPVAAKIFNVLLILFEYLGKASEHLGNFLTKLRDYIRENGTVVGALDDITGGFGRLGDGIKKVIDFLGSFFGNLLGIESIDEVWKKVGEGAKFVTTFLGDLFSNFGKAVGTIFSDGGVVVNAMTLAGSFYSLLLGWRKIERVQWSFNRVSRAVTFLKEGVKSLYNWAKAFNFKEWATKIQGVLGATEKSLRAMADNLNSKSLINIGLAVITLAFGLSILARVAENGHLAPAITALTAVMGVMIGALFLLKKLVFGGESVFQKMTTWKDTFKNFFQVIGKAVERYFQAMTLKEIAKAALIFAAAILVLSLAVAGLAAVIKWAKPGTFWQAVGAIATLALVLVASAWALSAMMKSVGMLDSTKFIAIGVAIAAFGVSLLLIAGAVAALTAILKWAGPEVFWQAVGAIAALAVVLTLITILLSKFASDPMVLFSATAMIAIAAAMVILAIAVGIMSLVISNFGWEGLIAMAAGLIVLALAIGILSVAGAGALAAAGALVLAAVGVFIIAAAIAVLALAIFALSILPMDKTAAAGETLIKVLVTMAIVLGVLSLLGPGVLMAGGAILLAGLGVLALCSGLLELAAALPMLATGLRAFEGLDLTGTGKGMGKLAWGLTKLSVSGIFNKLGEDGYAALLPLASALKVMESLDFAKLTDKDHGLAALGSALKKFGSAGIRLNWGDMGLTGAGPAFTSLAVGLMDLIPALDLMTQMENFDSVPNLLKTITSSIKPFGEKNVTKAYSGLETVAGSMATLAGAFAMFPEELPLSLVSLLSLLQNGLSDTQVVAANTMGNFLNEMLLAIEAYKGNFEIAGGNITVGIANGILSRTADAARAMTTMAGVLQRSFSVSLQIHSPSRVMEELAEYIPMGIARGIQNGSSEITSAIQMAMAPVLSEVENSAMAGADYTPTIKPVMDLADVQSGISNANRMFMGSAVGNISGLNGLNIDGDAINYNMSNRDVLVEMKSLEARISELSEAMSGMQVILDSGLLVGGISAQMDRQFATMDMRNRRGN